MSSVCVVARKRWSEPTGKLLLLRNDRRVPDAHRRLITMGYLIPGGYIIRHFLD